MSVEPGTPLDLPEAMTGAEFRKFYIEESGRYPEGLGRPYLDIISLNHTGYSAALIQKLMWTGALGPLLVAKCLNVTRNRGGNSFYMLHNMLLITEKLQNYGIDPDRTGYTRFIMGLSYYMPARELKPIATVEELDGAVAVIRVLDRFLNVDNGVVKITGVQGYTHAGTTEALVLANKHLDRLLREQPEKTDLIISFLDDHEIGTTKKTLAALLEFLKSETPGAVATGWL